MASRTLRLTKRLVPVVSTPGTQVRSFHSPLHVCTVPFLPHSTSRTTTIGITPPSRFQRRWHTAPGQKNKQYNFEDVKKLSQNPSEDRILIDVREPDEYSAGHIATALNVPVKSAPEAWFLPPDEFEDRFGFPKPDPAKEVVFYCRAGVRSSVAASVAEQGGFTKVGEYRGSWLDWEKNGGEKST